MVELKTVGVHDAELVLSDEQGAWFESQSAGS